MIDIIKIDPIPDIATTLLYRDLEPGTAFTMYGTDVLRLKTELGHFTFYPSGRFINHDARRFGGEPVKLVEATLHWKLKEDI